ncbi:MAG: hypothetical protein RLW87_22835 [Alphaproteobacteria bacterium]
MSPLPSASPQSAPLSVRLSCLSAALLVAGLIGSEIFAVLSALFWATVGSFDLPSVVLTVALWLAAGISLASFWRLSVYAYGVERRRLTDSAPV